MNEEREKELLEKIDKMQEKLDKIEETTSSLPSFSGGGVISCTHYPFLCIFS